MRGGFLLEDGRVAEDAVADAAELVTYGLVDGLAVAVSVVKSPPQCDD